MLLQNIKNYIKTLSKKDRVDKITKKDIFIGILTSPISFLLVVTLIYFIKIIAYSFSSNNNINLGFILSLTIPFLISFLPFSIYSYFIYKYKTFYISSTGSLLLTIFSFSVITSVCLVMSMLSNKNIQLIGVIFIIVSLFVSFMIFSTKKEITLQLDDLNFIKKLKLAFIFFDNLGNSDKVVTFINKSDIFYYTQYIKINGYRISYAEINVFEEQFNKKVYNFNKDEINVVTMYAIN